MLVADPVQQILARHRVSGPWWPLRATGVANRIYATEDVILRIAVAGPAAVADAQTESVAAPVAHAAGVLTPRLLVFDDSRTLAPSPYSLWERVEGETLGALPPHARLLPEVWRAVGQQLALLHRRVSDCPDPRGWLDHPARATDLSERLANLLSANRVEAALGRRTEHWIAALRPALAVPTQSYFLHNDIHEMNLMCGRDGSLRALIDWGDAGWGDPSIEFAQIPLPALRWVIAGYEAEAPGRLGVGAEARILWDKLADALEALPEDAGRLRELQRFVLTAEAPFGALLPTLRESAG
jgi:aminoglycoside phosphotransferase (APT) family kinase protein